MNGSPVVTVTRGTCVFLRVQERVHWFLGGTDMWSDSVTQHRDSTSDHDWAGTSQKF